MKVDTTELMAAVDIAIMFDVRQSAVSNWQHRELGFPAPVVTVANGAVKLWRRSDVLRWWTARHGETVQDKLDRHRLIVAELERMQTPTN